MGDVGGNVDDIEKYSEGYSPHPHLETPNLGSKQVNHVATSLKRFLQNEEIHANNFSSAANHLGLHPNTEQILKIDTGNNQKLHLHANALKYMKDKNTKISMKSYLSENYQQKKNEFGGNRNTPTVFTSPADFKQSLNSHSKNNKTEGRASSGGKTVSCDVYDIKAALRNFQDLSEAISHKKEQLGLHQVQPMPNLFAHGMYSITQTQDHTKNKSLVDQTTSVAKEPKDNQNALMLAINKLTLPTAPPHHSRLNSTSALNLTREVDQRRKEAKSPQHALSHRLPSEPTKLFQTPLYNKLATKTPTSLGMKGRGRLIPTSISRSSTLLEHSDSKDQSRMRHPVNISTIKGLAKKIEEIGMKHRVIPH